MMDDRQEDIERLERELADAKQDEEDAASLVSQKESELEDLKGGDDDGEF